VDGRLVAAPAMPGPWQFPPADALLAATTRPSVQLLHQESPVPRLMIAGCDPAVSVLRRHLERAGVQLAIAAVNSSVAVQLLDQRLVHIAGTHLKDAETPRPGMATFRFAVWEQGLVLARSNPKKVKAIDALARQDIRLANREKGSGSRQLLDQHLRGAGIPLRDVAGYRDRPAAGHMEAAWRVHAGLADCCVATRSAARAFGLDFLPLTSERYDLMIREDHLRLGAVERLLDTLTHSALRRELEGLCAYDTRETGNRVQ
jgi:molybdate-binding protein